MSDEGLPDEVSAAQWCKPSANDPPFDEHETSVEVADRLQRVREQLAMNFDQIDQAKAEDMTNVFDFDQDEMHERRRQASEAIDLELNSLPSDPS